MTDKENYIARQVLDRLIKSEPSDYIAKTTRHYPNLIGSSEKPVWDEAAIKEFAKQYEKKKK